MFLKIHYLLIIFILFCLMPSVFAQPGLVRVIAPNGGEIFYVGDTITVQWETDTNLVPQVFVEISSDSGKTFFGMTARSVSLASSAWGNVLWAIPDTFKGNISTQSTACLVQVYSYFDASTNDLSDSFFTIKMPVDLSAPDGGETFIAGDVMHIHWTADAQHVSSVKLYISTDSGITYAPIAADSIAQQSPGWGDFVWTIPDSLGSDDSLDCRIKIISVNKAGIHDQTAGFFTIKPSAPEPEPDGGRPGCGCGSGAGLAFIPPIGFKIRRLIKKKKA